MTKSGIAPQSGAMAGSCQSGPVFGEVLSMAGPHHMMDRLSVPHTPLPATFAAANASQASAVSIPSMARSALLGSSLTKKYWMALTGLFLVLFLFTHLAGNLQLLDMSPDGQLRFNAYARFMTTFLPVKIASYLLYASILFHAFDGFLLAIQNRKARPLPYSYEKPSANSTWYSRQMALLGTLILVFLVIHMKRFWYEMHWGDIGMDANGNKDLYTVVAAAFSEWWYVALYVVMMAALAYHLLHGFASSFQSLGLNHPRYTPIIKNAGVFIAVVLPIFFALIPVWMFVNS